MKRIIQYFKECFSELKRVTWPSRDEVTTSTKVVLISVALFAVVLGVIDFLLSAGIDLLF